MKARAPASSPALSRRRSDSYGAGMSFPDESAAGLPVGMDRCDCIPNPWVHSDRGQVGAGNIVGPSHPRALEGNLQGEDKAHMKPYSRFGKCPLVLAPRIVAWTACGRPLHTMSLAMQTPCGRVFCHWNAASRVLLPGSGEKSPEALNTCFQFCCKCGSRMVGVVGEGF